MDPAEITGALWDATRSTWRFAPRSVRAIAAVITRTFNAYTADNCSIYAAAIAYYAIFSVIPLAILTLAVAGLLVPESRVVDFVFEQLPLEESISVRENVETIVSRTAELSGFGLAFGTLALLWTASGVFSAMRRGLNAVTHSKRGHPWVRGKLIDIALVPFLGLLIVSSLLLTIATQQLLNAADDYGPVALHRDTLGRVSSAALAVTMTFTFFTLIYRFVPSDRPGWKEALTGSIVATLLFELTKNIITLVIGSLAFSRDTALYTGLGTALAFLYLMMVNGSILLIGAEFGHAAISPRHARGNADEANGSAGGHGHDKEQE